MKHVGIICEYNPFHEGHRYLLNAVREAETVVCVMSGPFTQRGEAAVIPPSERAAMALACGADLVVELPFPYAAGSARHFATAGVRVLTGLGVDTIAFGSESADAPALLETAARTLTPDFAEKVANGAKNKGDAAAYFEALGEARISPNDILALEYARAVHKGGSCLSIYPVLRQGAGYHDTDAEQALPSATALRQKLQTGADICDNLPIEVRQIWHDAVAQWGIADIRRLGGAMLVYLRGATSASVSSAAECSGGLGERLIRAAWEAWDYDSLCHLAATKKYTDGRIRRSLLYGLAGVTRADLKAPPAYVKLLGANERGRAFLAAGRKTRTLPVVTKPADAVALGECAVRARRLAAVADGLYALCMEKGMAPGALSTRPPLML